MNVIFLGSGAFGVPTLEMLARHHRVIAVVTQPDRPAGRGKVLTPTPVGAFAAQHLPSVPIFKPENVNEPGVLSAIRKLSHEHDARAWVVIAFGQKLSPALLDGVFAINLHASLLPRWRGAAPIQGVIRAGDKESGITIMKMDAGLDTGPILSQRAIPLAADETGASLHDKLAALGAELLMDTLPGYLSGAIQPQPQDDSLATYAPTIAKEEGNIDWTQAAASIERLVRAFTPWPGTYTTWNSQMLKILSGKVGKGYAKPGQVVSTPDGIGIGTGDGLYLLRQVQLAGRKVMSVEEFVRGQADFVGTKVTP